MIVVVLLVVVVVVVATPPIPAHQPFTIPLYTLYYITIFSTSMYYTIITSYLHVLVASTVNSSRFEGGEQNIHEYHI